MGHPDHEINRDAWNKMVDLHFDHPSYLTQHFIDGGISLKRLEQEILGDVTGKELMHLMCQFGLDTLSWARKGAKVTGVDISDRSIERAHELMDKSGVRGEFIRSDVLDLIGVIDKKFDIIYQSYGTHGWISDIFKWAEVIAHYLKDDGIFLLIDHHPLEVLYYDPPEHYFEKEPIRDINPVDYCETETRIDGEHVEWQHPISEFVNAFHKAGLKIKKMEEYNFGYYRREKDWYKFDDDYYYPAEGPPSYPMLMSMVVGK